MPAELVYPATALVLAVNAFLLLPKPPLRPLLRRFGAALAGRRYRVLSTSHGEVVRLAHLGVPLHAAALVAELHGAGRRREQEAAWQQSPAGLLLRQLAGQLAEAERLDRLRAQCVPTPASKLAWSVPARLTMPPMSWRTDWERHLESLHASTDTEPAAIPVATLPVAVVTAEPSRPTPAELEIRTLGEIRLLADGKDLAPRLLRRPAQAVTWLYLLAREARRPGDRLIRGVFADELFPGHSPDQQRRKARQRLADLNRDFPMSLRRRIVVDGEYIGLNLTACDLDVRRVLDTAAAATTLDPDDVLSPAGLGNMSWALHASSQEFLPGWEETERRATDRRSGMTDVVEAVRSQVEVAHVTILETLANAHLARERPVEAVSLLEEALRRRPERGDLARKLFAACERAGLGRRAAEVRLEHGLDDRQR